MNQSALRGLCNLHLKSRRQQEISQSAFSKMMQEQHRDIGYAQNLDFTRCNICTIIANGIKVASLDVSK